MRLHHLVGGDENGPPVLLWHGFLGTSYTWRGVMSALADAGYAVLVPDMRGYGDSDKPEGTDGYDGRSLAEDFRALVGSTGFGAGRPITLVAHDMGAPPALLWAADHPDEVARLFYLDEPVMLSATLDEIIAYNPGAMADGSLWWWVLALAPGVPEALIVGNEAAFLAWFYNGATARREAIDDDAVAEYLRTFTGTVGVLGALGVYRAAFTTIEQTTPLAIAKVRVPVVALGGDAGQGDRVREMVQLVASDVTGGTVLDCGHFVPEERPDELVGRIMAATPLDGDRRPPGHENR